MEEVLVKVVFGNFPEVPNFGTLAATIGHPEVCGVVVRRVVHKEIDHHVEEEEDLKVECGSAKGSHIHIVVRGDDAERIDNRYEYLVAFGVAWNDNEVEAHLYLALDHFIDIALIIIESTLLDLNLLLLLV